MFSAKDIVKIDNGNNGNSGNNGNKGNSGNNGNNGDNGDNGNNGNNGNSGNNGKSSDNSNNQNKGQEGKTGKGSAEKNGQTSQKSQQNKQQKNEEHHRAEPQPASAQTIQSGSGLAALAVPKCFSGDMEIQTKQGVKLMNKLEVGDNVSDTFLQFFTSFCFTFAYLKLLGQA